MSTLTIELPDTLKHRLDEEARRRRISPARLIRRTLEASLSNGKEHSGPSLYELTRDLCGSVSGGRSIFSARWKFRSTSVGSAGGGRRARNPAGSTAA